MIILTTCRNKKQRAMLKFPEGFLDETVIKKVMFIKLFELSVWDFSESIDYRNKKLLKKKNKN